MENVIYSNGVGIGKPEHEYHQKYNKDNPELRKIIRLNLINIRDTGFDVNNGIIVDLAQHYIDELERL